MAIKAADTLKPNGSFALAEAEDITIRTADGGEERLPANLARVEDNAYAYTDAKVADLVGGAPETLDTLKEIADELAKNETAMEAITAAVQNHTHAEATAETAGFMSAADKASLDSTGGETVETYVGDRLYEYQTTINRLASENAIYYCDNRVGTWEYFKTTFYKYYNATDTQADDQTDGQ